MASEVFLGQTSKARKSLLTAQIELMFFSFTEKEKSEFWLVKASGQRHCFQFISNITKAVRNKDICYQSIINSDDMNNFLL